MARQVSKNASITPEMDRFIANPATSGRYQNASEEAIRQERLLQFAGTPSRVEG